eukprot:tig00000411_g537.t1
MTARSRADPRSPTRPRAQHGVRRAADRKKTRFRGGVRGRGGVCGGRDGGDPASGRARAPRDGLADRFATAVRGDGRGERCAGARGRRGGPRGGPAAPAPPDKQAKKPPRRRGVQAASSALTPIGPLGQEPTIAEAILFSPAPTPTLLANMFASGVARLVAISATHPIDTVKTKVQTSRGEPRPALETLRLIVKQQGVTGLYAGLDGTMIGQVPYSAVAFGIYERSSWSATSPSLFAHILCYLVCGSLGDLTGSLIVVPSEVVKTRLQAGTYATAKEAIDSILEDTGFRGFYAGYSSQLIRDVPFRAIQATVFELLRLAPSLCDNILAMGMIAGAVAAALTTPLDVVKTRLMAQDPHAAPPTPAPDGAPRDPAPYRGPINALVRIAGEEGPGALLRGLGPRVLVIAPMSSIFFAVYEAMRALLSA